MNSSKRKEVVVLTTIHWPLTTLRCQKRHFKAAQFDHQTLKLNKGLASIAEEAQLKLTAETPIHLRCRARGGGGGGGDGVVHPKVNAREIHLNTPNNPAQFRRLFLISNKLQLSKSLDLTDEKSPETLRE